MSPKVTKEALDSAISAEERQRREDSADRRLLKAARKQIASMEAQLDILTVLDGLVAEPTEWLAPLKSSTTSRGVANLMLSDLHLDEVIRPEQLNGRNAYNREIAEYRLTETIHRTIKLCRDYVTGVNCDGIVVWLGGDNVSGNIHAELRKTNAGQDVIDTVDFWVDHVASALVALADYFGKVHVVCQFGNHGRNTEKPESKDAIRSSFDWLFCRIMWRALKSDTRISWNIPESLIVQETVLNTRYHFEHGDAKAFRGGDQVAGPLRPVMMGIKRRREQGYVFDRLLICHFHSYSSIPAATMNGSLIGPSQYSDGSGYSNEPPTQSFWIETPENGPAFNMPILPGNPQKEGWAS